MLKIYNTNMETNKVEEIKEFKKGSWISLINPSEAEIKNVCESISIQEDFIRDALDYEEKARIDHEEDDDTTLFVVDVPVIEKSEENDIYATMPLGMIVVRDDFFVTVSLRKNKVIEDFTKNKIKNFQTYKKTRFIFTICNSSFKTSMERQWIRQRKRKHVDEFDIKQAEIIAPAVSDEIKSRAGNIVTLDYSTGYGSSDLYSMITNTDKGAVQVLFNADEKLIEAMRHMRPSIVKR